MDAFKINCTGNNRVWGYGMLALNANTGEIVSRFANSVQQAGDNTILENGTGYYQAESGMIQ